MLVASRDDQQSNVLANSQNDSSHLLKRAAARLGRALRTAFTIQLRNYPTKRGNGSRDSIET
jgi:hypothetical protein